MPEPLLDLTTGEEPRPVIRIDGEPFELPRYDDLGLRSLKVVSDSWQRMNELEAKSADELTDADEAEYLVVTDRIVRTVLPGLSDETFTQLDRQQKGAIVIAFFSSRLQTQLFRTMVRQATGAGSDGGSSSPDSSGSTAATGSDG